MKLVFGFDMGTTSLGSAVIRFDENLERGEILHLGVRIFPEARDPDGTPLNQQRRAARTMRRQLRRRRDRRRDVNELLASVGLLPRYNSAQWASTMAIDPYVTRREGLSRALLPEELGRALYHLSKRRHFRGRDDQGEGPDGEKATAEEQQQSTARAQTIRILKETGQTLGTYLSEMPKHTRRRGVHAIRDNVVDEFQRLISFQAQYHPVLSSPEFSRELEDTIFFQRPVFWRKNTLGECRLMPGSQLAPKASWLSIQRRMLEKLNNLAISGGNGRPLEAVERAAILQQLQTQGSMSWPKVRKLLEPLFRAQDSSTRHIRFNLEEGGDKGLPGNPLEMKLIEIFGDEWEDHPSKQEIRDALDKRLRAADYGEMGQRIVILREGERKARRRAAAESFAADFGASAAQVDALEQLSFPTGWDAYSSDAITIILPLLESGIRFGTVLNGPEFHDWRNENFPHRDRPTGEILDRLPSPRDKDESTRQRSIRNPTVVRCQNELRKVTNNLIAVYGKPDLIRVELSREVGLSKAEREEKTKAMRKQENARKDAVNGLKAQGIAEPSRADIEKWLLWKESGGRDPYSGDHIGFDALFREGLYEVEHIWPRSRSLDDSFANKTLCRRDLNLLKGNRLPVEAFSADPDQWAAMKTRVAEMLAPRNGVGMSRGKIRRFLADSIPDDFTTRQLNDTGYAARQAAGFLRRLWPDLGPQSPVNVQTVNGKVTAHLRRLWGLNNILSDDGEKTRADHRHHAIDALVVACAHPGITARLSRYWQQRDTTGSEIQRPQLTPPWATIREDATAAVAGITVSHRVRKKISGPLHKGTVYGDTGLEEVKGKTTYRLFTVRKAVAALSKGEIAEIRDPSVRKTVKDWVSDRGGDPKKAFPPYPVVSPEGPEIRRVRIMVKQQMSLMAPATTGFADLGSNHHIAIYVGEDGRAEYEVVSLFEAARRNQSREPVIRRKRGGARLFMSLSPGEAVDYPDGNKRGLWIVKGVWADGRAVLERPTDASGLTTTRPGVAALIKDQVRKVSIDPIGRIRIAHD